ncbi:MAG: GerMN domain-containing protein [Peptoniphilus sp.]|nr:GerMN domain-containing protein [Peptoniphilus sp.]MDD7362714.1 GerMN domain-containing protein [Bacillota bacterium]MDY6044592.1 GerMN domain-containing protein [Peptoniphilus sp.]
MKPLKKIMLTSLSLSLCLLATACAQEATAENADEKPVEVVETQKTPDELDNDAENKDKQETDQDDEKDASEHNEKTDKADGKDDAEETKTYDVSLTYPSTDYIVEGNEEDKTVIESAKIEANDETVVVSVLDKLAQKPASDKAEPTGLDKYDYSASTLDGSTAIVDLKGNLQGGSLDEDVLVSSIVNSLLSVDGIESVSFTVNGDKADTLMGHVDVAKPFTAPVQ